MIDTTDALMNLCVRMESSSLVALDTEFISGESPTTILAVVQVGFNQQDVFLIDALAFDDLSILKPILECENIPKVMHDAGQDLALISQSSGATPRNIFDIKMGARLIGAGTYYSLSEIVHSFCGIHLSKEQQRSDWLARPLSDAQMTYAKEDIMYLPEIREMILSEAEKMGRLSWIEEEMGQFNHPHNYTPLSGADQILRSSATYFLKPRQRAVAAALADWRQQASELSWIAPKKLMKDGEILRLATREVVKPASVGRICRSLPRRYEVEVAKLISKTRKTPDQECPASHARQPLIGTESVQLRLLQTVVYGCAYELGIQSELIASKSVLNDFILQCDKSDSVLLNGWRRDVIGEDLLNVLEGVTSVKLNNGRLKLGPTGDHKL